MSAGFHRGLLGRDTVHLLDEVKAGHLVLALRRRQRIALSVYDAVYLELALRRNLPLASRDTALNKAAKNAGVTTLL